MILFESTAKRPEGSSSRFVPGELVRHRRYGYRGVVVDLDASCQAPDDWYASNQTRPDKAQPWYHVLVHGSESCTYAAEENLERDPVPAEISHPLLPLFFERFSGNAYVRNDRPWESF